MTFCRPKAIEPNYVFMQVKGAVYRGRERLVNSRGFVLYIFKLRLPVKTQHLVFIPKKEYRIWNGRRATI